MAIREGDVGVIIDFDTGEDITDASSVQLFARHRTKGLVVELTPAAIEGTQIVRHTTIATDFMRAGAWDVQARVIQPGKDRRTAKAELTVEDSLVPQ